MKPVINFLSKRQQRVERHISNNEYLMYCGLLTSPATGYDVSDSHRWAADNDCFNFYKPQNIMRMLERYQDSVDTCQFVVAPDRVQDSQMTLELFNEWCDTIKKFGYPVAFVLQDGISLASVPWERADVIFIGGSNQFKYSQLCRDIVKEANRLNKWVHNGRVSSILRLTYSHSIGVNSIDGTHYIYEPTNIKKHQPFQRIKQYLLL